MTNRATRILTALFLVLSAPGVSFAQEQDGRAAGTQPNAPAPSTQPQASRAQSLFGDIAPKLAELTDEVLYRDVWERPGLSKRDRSLATVSALVAMNRPDQLRSHLGLARRNGVTQDELVEAITHLAFYAGWPSAVSAATVAKEVLPPLADVAPDAASHAPPLLIQAQGSFAAGGTVARTPGMFDPLRPAPAGQSLHGDHARVFYQVPVNARALPLVMWHGFGQFSKTWETTPDGREGFQNIFLRRRFPVYVIDQPRRGGAARGTVGTTIAAATDDQQWFNTFRLGTWPDFFPGVQFSDAPETLNQYFRQMTPDTGPFDAAVAVDATSALFDRIGPGVLVTHSHSGGLGWRTAMKNRNIKGIVSYEPGSGFVFPEGEVPPAMPSAAGPLEAAGVPLQDFMALTRIPISIYYGDNIPAEPSTNPGHDGWRVRLAMARLWVEAVKRHGGDATVVHLPEVGIRGNTHFPFSDLNNIEIANLMSEFLAKKGLDGENAKPKESDPAATAPSPAQAKETEQELLRLSKDKWGWMSDRKVDLLADLFHEEAVFVHMGATMSREQELDTIKNERIVYKSVDIQDASVRITGTTAIVLSRIRLVALVGGNEVTNPFMVTEVYVREGGAWKLASLSFTRLMGS